jgi:hypothetical protein
MFILILRKVSSNLDLLFLLHQIFLLFDPINHPAAQNHKIQLIVFATNQDESSNERKKSRGANKMFTNR